MLLKLFYMDTNNANKTCIYFSPECINILNNLIDSRVYKDSLNFLCAYKNNLTNSHEKEIEREREKGDSSPKEV